MQQAALYRMPAEWEAHTGTWIGWPHNKEHWPGNFEPIPYVYVDIVRALAKSEKVFVYVNDEEMQQYARMLLEHGGVMPKGSPRVGEKISGLGSLMSRVQIFQIPTNASWSRDHGPIFVKNQNQQLVALDWIFNCWGEKYPPWDLDDAVPQKVGPLLNIPVISPGIVLEGGAIDVNGKGALLTTEQCLLNKNRNPHLSRVQIEGYLAKYLGATTILWLKEGIIGDDTDGHIDDIARFVDSKTVVCAVEENSRDENYHITQKNFRDLQNMKDQDGNPLRVIKLPMPDPVVYENRRLPASYANFYIANKAVVMPIFRCPKDEEALMILAELFPTREIIPIDSVEYIWGLGTVHCSTQQQPA